MNSSKSIKCILLGTGTSQGVPVIACDCEVCLSNDPRDRRLRTSALIQVGNKNIIIDAGPDFRQQVLRTKIKTLDGLLLTHDHNDHVIGIDDIRPFNFSSNKSLNVYGTKRVLEILKYRFDYIFLDKKYPGAPSVNDIEISNSSFEVEGIEIIPIEANHGDINVTGYRFGDLAYLTDVKAIQKNEIAKLAGLKSLIISALHHETHHSHMTLHEALELIKEINPERAYLTHASHRMGLYRDVEKMLPENVKLGFDGLEIVV